MSATVERCPLCAEWNKTTDTNCVRCRYRLPWADELENAPDQRPKVADELPVLTEKLKNLGLLPERVVACRFCNSQIEIDARQCPHCEKWLVASRTELLDPAQPTFRKKDLARTGIEGPRAGCFSQLCWVAFAVGLVAQKIWW